MNSTSLAEEISNKNNFIDVCSSLGIPTVKSFACYSMVDFLEIQELLPKNGSFLIKPMRDRLQLSDNRRRFTLCENIEDLRIAISKVCLNLSEGDGVQVQEYVNFQNEPVDYYNVTFNISDVVSEYITTKQIINLAGIHSNIVTVHWGNTVATPHKLLGEAENYTRKLAQHYFDIGYRGDIGIDFGLRGESIFFLETNARANNGTRLYYELKRLGLDPKNANYLYVWSKLLNYAENEVASLSSAGEIQVYKNLDGRVLITAMSEESIEKIFSRIDLVARTFPPLECSILKTHA